MLELNMNSVFNDTTVKSYKLTCIEMLLVLSRFLYSHHQKISMTAKVYHAN